MTTKQKLTQLRRLMKAHRIHCYLVPNSDPHQSEYVAECWQRRKWLSGFTGSAGDLVVTQRSAGLWVDGRYFLQAEQQLRGSGIDSFRMGMPGVPSQIEWLSKNLPPKSVVGADLKTLSLPFYEKLVGALKDRGSTVRSVQPNLVDEIWRDRPPLPSTPLSAHPLRFSGEACSNKLARVRQVMARSKVDWLVVTRLDDVAWLFNVRGGDIPYNPVAIAYGLIGSQRALLYVDSQKVTPSVKQHLRGVALLRDYQRFDADIKQLNRKSQRVWLDSDSASAWFQDSLRHASCIVRPSPVARMKAQKNSTEARGTHAAHLRDGVAMVRFLFWLDRVPFSSRLSEISAATILEQIRARGRHFRGLSFSTISAYGPHGAIVHYSADAKSDVPLARNGLYLLDSGAQYLDGTTDITRTLFLGKRAQPDHKRMYTTVLKGHIALATCTFPAGTTGGQLDALVRGPLWKLGLNYRHGSGHGLGSYLCVHEGPPSLHPSRGGFAFEEGNIITNEPGYYADGKFGIRLENAYLVIKDKALSTKESVWLSFEALTLCPWDLKLIEPALLSADERNWLNHYHELVFSRLSRYLTKQESRWLRKATRKV